MSAVPPTPVATGREPGAGPPVSVVHGDLVAVDDVEAIVNAWNRNVLPWWLLVPSGVAGAIRRAAGTDPFRELWRHGPIALGDAVTTGAGRLPLCGIVHVAGINLAWRASEASVAKSVQSALTAARARSFSSIAFPIIGSGTGGLEPDRSLAVMLDAIECDGAGLRVVVVRRRQERAPCG